MSRDVIAPWRLRELPDLRVGNAALGRAWRARRKFAAGRRRTGVVDRPINDSALTSALTDVFCSNDVPVIFRRNPGAVNPCPESRRDNGVDPGVNISLLLGQHAS